MKTNFNLIGILSLGLSIAISSCKKEEPVQLATLTTSAITSITGTTSISGGDISNSGGGDITARGVVWSTSPNPTTANNSTSNGSGIGNYTSDLTGLTANTSYYLRAYAINSAGTAYGNQLSFTTTGGAGSISSLNCGSATNSGTLTSGTAASGVSSSVPYTGGNGGTHNGQTVSSTGVTGLTATLSAGSFASGSGSLTYTITGTPSGSGTASFALNIGGQSCTLTRSVNAAISTPGAGVTFNGYTYSSIVLGNGQEWMAENLRTNSYANGDSIPNVTGATQWQSLTTGAWVHYNNDSQYENPYGKLYNWYTVNDPRNVCPVGWHVPTDAEWFVLTDYLGASVAGGKMKSPGTQYWQSLNTDATNESGFSGLPGGCLDGFGTSRFIGENGNWWSSTMFGSNDSYSRTLRSGFSNVFRYYSQKKGGFSVRCLRD
jgi:uncharacterized protein (TIGR02145 family)